MAEGARWQRQGGVTKLEWSWTAKGDGGPRYKRGQKNTKKIAKNHGERLGEGREGKVPPQRNRTRWWTKSHRRRRLEEKNFKASPSTK